MNFKAFFSGFLWCFLLLQSGHLQAVTLTAMGNQGVMLKSDKNTVYVDALYKHYGNWEGFSYDEPRLTPNRIKSNAIKRNAIKRNADASSEFRIVFLATHVHRDHFHPHLMGEVLNEEQIALFIGGSQSVESIKEAYINEHQIRSKMNCIASSGCDSKITISDSLLISGIATEHNHQHYSWVENIAFRIVLEGSHILHLGDAALSLNNINLLKDSTPVDVAIVPYWFLSDTPLLIGFLTEINPDSMLISHFPKEYIETIQNYTNSVVEKLPEELNRMQFKILSPGEELLLE